MDAYTNSDGDPDSNPNIYSDSYSDPNADKDSNEGCSCNSDENPNCGTSDDFGASTSSNRYGHENSDQSTLAGRLDRACGWSDRKMSRGRGCLLAEKCLVFSDFTSF